MSGVYRDQFAFVRRNDMSAFDLDFVAGLDPATNHSSCYITTREVEEWHARFARAGLPITPVNDTP